jgi:4-hydroxy-4-methyl-2-oxoglutarate aldolase
MDRTDWWDAIEKLPTPRVAVIQDLEPEAYGSVVGEVHCAILRAFRCEGVITNGAVRDIPAVTKMAFPMFARHAAVSHSYAHIVDYGKTVRILGLEIGSGELIAADCHGAVLIPHEIAAELPRVAAEIRAHEQRIIAVCQSPDFTPAKLREVIEGNH